MELQGIEKIGFGFLLVAVVFALNVSRSFNYGNPDFVKYAESYGAKGFKIQKAAELLPTLEKAFMDKGPVIIECPIDYSENKTVWSEELSNITCPN